MLLCTPATGLLQQQSSHPCSKRTEGGGGCLGDWQQDREGHLKEGSWEDLGREGVEGLEGERKE